MIFKKTTITALTFFVILCGCGFKPLKISNTNNISLAELDMKGNKIINFKISSYLKQTLNFKKNNLTKIKVLNIFIALSTKTLFFIFKLKLS